MTDIQTCADFVANLQRILKIPSESSQEKYFDLSTVNTIDKEELFRTPDLPVNDPVELAFELLLVEIEKEHLDKVIFGFNELFKSYLRNLTPGNQKELTDHYCKRILYLFRRSLNTFCYSEEVWIYLGNCFRPISLYLLEQQLLAACATFWEYASKMGKLAMKHGLHTDRLQRSLRIFEVEADEQGYSQLAALVKNLRHNLEN